MYQAPAPAADSSTTGATTTSGTSQRRWRRWLRRRAKAGAKPPSGTPGSSDARAAGPDLSPTAARRGDSATARLRRLGAEAPRLARETDEEEYDQPWRVYIDPSQAGRGRRARDFTPA
jgi:hypothetical protein